MLLRGSRAAAHAGGANYAPKRCCHHGVSIISWVQTMQTGCEAVARARCQGTHTQRTRQDLSRQSMATRAIVAVPSQQQHADAA